VFWWVVTGFACETTWVNIRVVNQQSLLFLSFWFFSMSHTPSKSLFKISGYLTSFPPPLSGHLLPALLPFSQWPAHITWLGSQISDLSLPHLRTSTCLLNICPQSTAQRGSSVGMVCRHLLSCLSHHMCLILLFSGVDSRPCHLRLRMFFSDVNSCPSHLCLRLLFGGVDLCPIHLFF